MRRAATNTEHDHDHHHRTSGGGHPRRNSAPAARPGRSQGAFKRAIDACAAADAQRAEDLARRPRVMSAHRRNRLRPRRRSLTAWV
jgi:hypothetical protein